MAPSLVPTTFEYVAERDHESVLIKGSWDRWQSFAALQKTDDNPLLWQVHITLNPGTVLFKFVVDNDWVYAPNYKHISDGFGGMNNERHIEPLKGIVSAEPEPQGNTQPTDSEPAIPSTYASVREVADVDFRHHRQLLPSVHHSHDEAIASEHEQSETQTDSAQQPDEPAQSAIPTLSKVEGVQHTKSNPPSGAVTFEYPCEKPYENVSVRGSWDGWKVPHPLVLSEEHGTWSADINLPVGSFLFKFIVDEQWTHSAEYEVQSDDFGGFNNVINVTASDSILGDTCEFSDALDTVLQPRSGEVGSETLSARKEEDVYPVENLNASDHEDPTFNPISPQARENIEEENHAEQQGEVHPELEQEPSIDQEPKSVGSDKPEETEPTPHVSDVEDKLEAKERSIAEETYLSQKEDSPETEQAESTNVIPDSEAVNGDHDAPNSGSELGSRVPVQDLDASSEEHVEADQAEKSNGEKLSDAEEVLVGIINESGGREKEEERNDGRGCSIC